MSNNDAGRPPHSKLEKARRYAFSNGGSLTVINGGSEENTPGNDAEKKEAAAAKVEIEELLALVPALDEKEMRIFTRLFEILQQESRYKKSYLDQMWNYSKCVARIHSLTEFLEENKWTYSTYGRNGTQYKKRPEAILFSEEVARHNSLCGKFGLTPLDELRFDGGQGDLFGENPFGKVPG